MKNPQNKVVLRLIKASPPPLDRSVIKKSVMTYSYNTSIPVMVDYIKNLLVHQKEKRLNPYKNIEESVYNVEGVDPNNYLFVSDIYYFVKCFTAIIKRAFPNALKKYTKELVKICIELNMPLREYFLVELLSVRVT